MQKVEKGSSDVMVAWDRSWYRRWSLQSKRTTALD